MAIVFDDPDHFIYEERFLIIGYSSKSRALIVSHCLREDNKMIRIISARKATRSERKHYEEGW